MIIVLDKHFILAAIFYVLFFFPVKLAAQEEDAILLAGKIIEQRGEVYFYFIKPADDNIHFFTASVSVDKLSGDTIFAYANRKEFDWFLEQGISFGVLKAPSFLVENKLLKSINTSWKWNGYPAYQEYTDMLQSFSMNERCFIDTIGFSVKGRLLLAAGISGEADKTENKPRVFLTSSMHGDETVGFYLMLRLIDSLITGYEYSERIKKLVDNTAIYINPLANPDGLYFSGDSNVIGATRYNANHIDLNRNFPDPGLEDHPDGNAWQPETESMMDYMKKRNFHLSANFHGGAEVVNYPWDTWSRLHPDDTWFKHISAMYADTAQHFGPAAYFTSITSSGISNGYDWYTIDGGRQDYMTYFLHGREVTIEVSNTKMPSPANLASYWEYNKNSLLNYIAEATKGGLQGRIFSTSTGLPIVASVKIPGHDEDNSFVKSDTAGYYRRLIQEGMYDLLITGGEDTLHVMGLPLHQTECTNMDFYIPSQGIAGSFIYPADSVVPGNIFMKFSSDIIDTVLMFNEGSNNFSCLIPPGVYNINITSEGYDTSRMTNVEIAVNTINIFDIDLSEKSGSKIEMERNGDAIVFPNPFKSDFYISFEEGIQFPIFVTCYSITGRIIFRPGNISPGYYFLKIEGQSLVKNMTIVKAE